MSCTEVDVCTAGPKALNIDDEMTAETPAQFRVLQGAVCVFAPTAGKDQRKLNNHHN